MSTPRPPALALLELASIARGIVVLDSLTKRAQVVVHFAEAVSPGKFLILFAGQVGEVEEAFFAGKTAAASTLIDELLLFDAHPALIGLIGGTKNALVRDEALLINEYTSVGSALKALDRALKAAAVQAKKLHLARGIGGKAYYVLGGELSDIQAAADAARETVPEAQVFASEQIARLSPDIRLEHL